MTPLFRITAAGLLLSLAGCKTMPVYTPAPDEKTVAVRFVGAGQPSVCIGGKVYRLTLVKDKNQQIGQLPVDKRITVSSFQTYQGYQVISTCHAALSLVPKSGKPSIINSGLDGGRCYIEAVLEDGGTATGVALDPTVGSPRC